MKKVILPRNAFGVAVMLLLLFLTAAVPFAVSFWLVSLVAPWWVSFPSACLISLVTFLKLVKFNY